MRACSEFADSVPNRPSIHRALHMCDLNSFQSACSSVAEVLASAHADIMSFSGLLPELINSRAAMFGMLAAFGAELGSRQPLFVQVPYSLHFTPIFSSALLAMVSSYLSA